MTNLNLITIFESNQSQHSRGFVSIRNLLIFFQIPVEFKSRLIIINN